MAEWVGDERAQTLTIEHVRADVWMYGGCTVRSTVEPRGCKNLDAAKTAAEQALRGMHDALAAHFAPSAAAALAAFGEAIATVARARLIERVTASDRVIAELGDGRAFELWPCDETLYVSGWGHDGMMELRKFHGDFEDTAAEAVAALIEECDR